MWAYDYRTNIRKETYNEAIPEIRWRKFSYADIIAREKTNFNIFWLKDDRLPDPDILANENIEAELASIREVARVLGE